MLQLAWEGGGIVMDSSNARWMRVCAAGREADDRRAAWKHKDIQNVRRLARGQRWQGCEIASLELIDRRRRRVLCHPWHGRTWTQEGVHSLWEWGHRQRAPQGVVPVARAQMDRREGPFTLGVKEDMTLASASETVDLHTRRFFYRELVYREPLITRSLHGELFKFSEK